MTSILKLQKDSLNSVSYMLKELKKSVSPTTIKDDNIAYSCSFGGCSGSCYGCSGCTSCSSCSGGCSGGYTYG